MNDEIEQRFKIVAGIMAIVIVWFIMENVFLSTRVSLLERDFDALFMAARNRKGDEG